jgi:hypothetical protein
MNRSGEYKPGLSCEEFEAAVFEEGPALGAEGALESDLREHAAACLRCSILLMEMRELNSALRGLAQADSQEGLPRQVEAKLLEAFRKNQGLGADRKANWHGAALAAAGVVLLILGMAVHRFMAPAPSAKISGEPVALKASEPVATDKERSEAVSTEDSESFLALAYSDGEANPEDGAIVRVLIPRAALASMGIPVSDISDERVPAEVVIGEDGTPQAIRLVSQEREEAEF